MEGFVWLLAVFIGYLFGSLPTGYIAGRIKGLDLRKVGSGNIGATNAFRNLGVVIGIVVLLVDVFFFHFPLTSHFDIASFLLANHVASSARDFSVKTENQFVR